MSDVVVFPAAIRGRYDDNNKVDQKLEVRFDDISNTITTVEKDNVVIIIRKEERKMSEKIKLTANILFAGIGCQERGIENTSLFDLEVLTTSEIDKEAVVSYATVHCGLTPEMIENYPDYPSKEEMAQHLTDINLGYDFKDGKPFDWFKLVHRKNKSLEKYWLACKLAHNRGDISKIEDLPYADFWTISSPCTDISIAGQMKGIEEGSGTRSALVWDSARLLQRAKDNGTLPRYIMFENVKNLVSKKFKDQFDIICKTLETIGFNLYWQVINAKDCGIPQNRERVFILGIRKDIDTGKFEFPKPFDNGLRLKDVLEDDVDEKYYINNDKAQKLIDELIENGALERERKKTIDLSTNNPREIEQANCITARYDGGISNIPQYRTGVVEQSSK